MIRPDPSRGYECDSTGTSTGLRVGLSSSVPSEWIEGTHRPDEDAGLLLVGHEVQPDGEEEREESGDEERELESQGDGSGFMMDLSGMDPSL